MLKRLSHVILLALVFTVASRANGQFRLGDSPSAVRMAMLELGGKIDSIVINFGGNVWLNSYYTAIADDTVATAMRVTFERDSVVSILTELRGLELETFEKDYGWIIKHPQVKRGAMDNSFRAYLQAGQSDYHLKYDVHSEYLIVEVTKPGVAPSMDDHLQLLQKKL